MEVDLLRAQVASREARISELEQDLSSATFKNMMLEIEVGSPFRLFYHFPTDEMLTAEANVL